MVDVQCLGVGASSQGCLVLASNGWECTVVGLLGAKGWPGQWVCSAVVGGRRRAVRWASVDGKRWLLGGNLVMDEVEEAL